MTSPRERPDTAALVTWQVAEQALGIEGEVERAAERLPARQARLLRALDALERGERADVEAMIDEAQAAGDAQVAWALRVATTTLSPTEIRKAAKSAGTGSSELPFLDLLRLARSFALGRKDQPRPGVRGLARRRELVDCFTNNAAGKGRYLYYYSRWLQAAWPRPFEVCAALRTRHQRGHYCGGCHAREFGDPALDLAAPRWASLAGAGGELPAWAGGDQPWGPRQDDALEHAMDDERRAREALGPLLVRLGRDLERGAVDRAVPVADACDALASRCAPGALHKQCVLLAARLDIVVGRQVEPCVLLGLWRQRGTRLRVTEQPLLADVLLLHPDDFDRATRGELRAACVAHGRLDRLAFHLDALQEEQGAVERRRLLEAAGIGPGRRRLVALLSSLTRGRPGLDALDRLVTEGHLAEAACGAGAVLSSRHARRSQGRLAHVLGALVRARLPARDWRHVLSAPALLLLPEAVLAHAEAQLERKLPVEDHAVFAAFVLRAGSDQRARQLVRDEGRALRGLKPVDARRRAFLVSLAAWDHHRARAPARARLQARGRPLAALLARSVDELVREVADRPMPAHGLALIRWLDAHRSIVDAADWSPAVLSWATDPTQPLSFETCAPGEARTLARLARDIVEEGEV